MTFFGIRLGLRTRHLIKSIYNRASETRTACLLLQRRLSTRPRVGLTRHTIPPTIRQQSYRGIYCRRIARPQSVNLHTNQSGLIGLLNQGSAQPCWIQLFTVRELIFCPSQSNKGSLPPGCSSPRTNQVFCDGLGLAAFAFAEVRSISNDRGF